MKRVLTRLLTFVLIAVILVAVVTPLAVRQARRWREGQIVGKYRAVTEDMSPMRCEEMLFNARSYAAARVKFHWSDPLKEKGDDGDRIYRGLLNPVGNGVMAVLEIPKLGTLLPVYHGTRDAALGAGVGHLAGSGLPVGDARAPCVLAARRGRWFAGPFAGLDRLIPGDCFYLRVLQDTLVYEVYQTLTLSVEELEAQEAGGDAEECVLVTTPYGDDTRRLLVWARRVSRRSVQPPDDSQVLPGWAARLVFAVPVALAGVLALTLVERLRRLIKRRGRRKMRI